MASSAGTGTLLPRTELARVPPQSPVFQGMPRGKPGLATELYAEIAQHLSSSNGDLVALGQASLMLNDVATRVLYTHIAVDAPSAWQVTALLCRLREDKALADLPRYLELHWPPPMRPGKREQPELAALLTAVLPTLKNLTYFSISPAIGVDTRAFDEVVMPSLVQFHSYSQEPISLAFLERHPKLTHLTLCQCRARWPSPPKYPFQELVYLRISSFNTAEYLLKRLSHPKLKRIVFGDYLGLDEVISCLDSYPTIIPHIDILGSYRSWAPGRLGNHRGVVSQRITTLGLSICDILPDIPGKSSTLIIRGVLQLFKAALFPNLAKLAIYCHDRSHHHEHVASWAFEAFIEALREESFYHLCISEFLGWPVMLVHRDGKWQWACAPKDNLRPTEYQSIPWPQQ
ncbi:hypothetical protein AURDEDRAFT_184109 [Auricularia subglabra TFB-10046 SS5]|nr:hypothetical protein AURDEDRAFT_184109 [Auricularia subglabra TFB-10046 SS5]